ncbi:hypothetical protein Aca07nite_83370 [Actinoplanes capillaceus]|uniref:ABM domain-containing protein n=1 Tax=Actinoplanes campanulatus TaxID=113559 RepID=A0ABQ3WXW0_9ACTN|nr:hypothetical protein [Actinoplanes capillaceus]GID51062.1 hypothetical protein Aca07nite_83370 [Actinoplanes capillaceus]
MPVIMILRLKADPNAVEEVAKVHGETLNDIAAAGKAAGATRHTFAGRDGEVLVIDEWPDEATFQQFFDSQPDIPRIMQAAGVEGPPEISFYRKLDTPDQF